MHRHTRVVSNATGRVPSDLEFVRAVNDLATTLLEYSQKRHTRLTLEVALLRHDSELCV